MLLNALSGDVELPAFAERFARKGKRLRGLEERGWVEETGDGTWALTDEGRAAKERLGAIVDGIRSRVAGAVSPEDFATTMASLEAIARELGWEEGRADAAPRLRPRLRRRVPARLRSRIPRGLRSRVPRQAPGSVPGFRPGFGPRTRRGPRAAPQHGAQHCHPHHEHGSHGHGAHHRGHHGHHGGRGHGERSGRSAQRAYERGFDAGFSRGRTADAAVSPPTRSDTV